MFLNPPDRGPSDRVVRHRFAPLARWMQALAQGGDVLRRVGRLRGRDTQHGNCGRTDPAAMGRTSERFPQSTYLARRPVPALDGQNGPPLPTFGVAACACCRQPPFFTRS